MGNLASTYSDFLPLRLEYTSTRRSKKIVGAEHPDTLIMIGNIASMYHDQGR
ncbi:hypothetical protein BYT27DRAFT_7266887 [Phlegmacium glaucopus]|nr:hypothetical protein BYT27DRAFT_7266887 [Phlegmacium glaucopus]